MKRNTKKQRDKHKNNVKLQGIFIKGQINNTWHNETLTYVNKYNKCKTAVIFVTWYLHFLKTDCVLIHPITSLMPYQGKNIIVCIHFVYVCELLFCHLIRGFPSWRFVGVSYFVIYLTYSLFAIFCFCITYILSGRKYILISYCI